MDANLIYSGPVHTISLWDSTNHELKLGYPGSEVTILQEPVQHELVDGNLAMYSVKTILEAALYESNPEKIGYLRERKNIQQDIFIVTARKIYKLNNVYISFIQERPFNSEEQHRIILTAQTKVENDFETITNLLSSVADGTHYGGMEATDPPPGWTEFGGPPIVSRQATFLASGGGSYCLQMVLTAIGDGVQCDIICPLEAQSITLIFSAYITCTVGTESLDIGIKQLSNADAVLATHESTITVDTDVNDRYNHSVTVTPNASQAKLRVYIQSNDNSGTIKIDNAQLEVYAISTYSENENV